MFAESASGNYLYHQEADGKFKQVAGVQAPAMTVQKAGWSWGGCFADRKALESFNSRADRQNTQ
jgi:hypothetical protein